MYSILTVCYSDICCLADGKKICRNNKYVIMVMIVAHVMYECLTSKMEVI